MASAAIGRSRFVAIGHRAVCSAWEVRTASASWGLIPASSLLLLHCAQKSHGAVKSSMEINLQTFQARCCGDRASPTCPTKLAGGASCGCDCPVCRYLGARLTPGRKITFITSPFLRTLETTRCGSDSPAPGCIFSLVDCPPSSAKRACVQSGFSKQRTTTQRYPHSLASNVRPFVSSPLPFPAQQCSIYSWLVWLVRLVPLSPRLIVEGLNSPSEVSVVVNPRIYETGGLYTTDAAGIRSGPGISLPRVSAPRRRA
jgi:hypothetical protein